MLSEGASSVMYQAGREGRRNEQWTRETQAQHLAAGGAGLRLYFISKSVARGLGLVTGRSCLYLAMCIRLHFISDLLRSIGTGSLS